MSKDGYLSSPLIDLNRKDHRVLPIKWMLIVGTLNTGMTFYGPFDQAKDAYQWATDHIKPEIQAVVNPFFYTPEHEEGAG